MKKEPKKEKPNKPVDQPPQDNEHVLEGAEKFDEPESFQEEPSQHHVVGTCSSCGGSGRGEPVGSLQSESCNNCLGTGIK